MAIQLIIPRNNARIAPLCIAYGLKGEHDPRPGGVLIGLRDRNGPLDHNRIVGGTTIVIKDKHGNEVQDRWAIRFEIDDAQKDDYFSLRLFTPYAMGATPPDRNQILLANVTGCTNLQIAGVHKTVDVSAKKDGSRNIRFTGVGYPGTTDHPPASGVIALGDLPENEVDVDQDIDQTYIDCSECETTRTGVEYAFPDGVGGYIVLFKEIPDGQGKSVTVHISYLDNGTNDDEVQNVVLS